VAPAVNESVSLFVGKNSLIIGEKHVWREKIPEKRLHHSQRVAMMEDAV
jgi:hypothetical protein